MKTKKIKQKLTLSKNIIANLNLEEMMVAKGGCTINNRSYYDFACILRSRMGCGRLDNDAMY